jgi:uncharacterized membrane protein
MAEDPGLQIFPAPVGNENRRNQMEKTSVGLPENIAGVLCYVAGWVSGLIFILIEPANRTVRFHAFQSVMVFGFLNLAYFVVYFVPVIDWMLNIIIFGATVIFWVVAVVKTYQGQKWRLPLIGRLAERWAAR